ncbi:MAG: DUF5651 domain-containing protein [Clostridium sp.]
MCKLKRTYLTAEEKNFYMISKAFIQYLDGTRNLENKVRDTVWTEWASRGMITPAMQKNLKLVKTYLYKFCNELEENLNAAEIERLRKQVNKFDYKLIDDYTVKKMLRDVSDNIKYAVMERDKFQNIMVDIAEVRCVGCKKGYVGCEIHDILEDIGTPYVGEQPNCPYACDLSELDKDVIDRINNLKERLKKKNRYFKG